ncbi:uncharacterized protein [Lolium perenne]|uniref:uncharacterized protein n=1 Tax=Lolium perenne TaxID=4522 RepID=UPI0021F5092F|nr:uncharacterized protein LOC127296285 isoform X2 [Lolium perenne]
MEGIWWRPRQPPRRPSLDLLVRARGAHGADGGGLNSDHGGAVTRGVTEQLSLVAASSLVPSTLQVSRPNSPSPTTTMAGKLPLIPSTACYSSLTMSTATAAWEPARDAMDQ